MTQVRPFKAMHPTFESASAIAALPYDVQSIEEARRIVAANPSSFLAIDEPIVNFPEGTDAYDPRKYEKAGEMLQAAQEESRLVFDERPSFYLYELTMEGRTQTGLVACVSVDDYLDGTVKAHEGTRVDKEADRVAHIEGCNAQTGPIFLAHRASEELSNIYDETKESELLFDFIADDGIRHRGFTIDERHEEAIVRCCEELGRVYIADGHHRIAAAATVAKKRRAEVGTGSDADWILSVLFADDELAILPYHRVILDLGNLSSTELEGILKERFDAELICDEQGRSLTMSESEDPSKTEESLQPKAKGEFCAFLNGHWLHCAHEPESIPNDPYESLDAALLQQRLLEPVLAIDDPRRSPRIDFVGGIRGLGELERRCTEDCVAAFALPATGIAELFAVADADLLMPPKSTWFEPKLRSGLFIHGI